MEIVRAAGGGGEKSCIGLVPAELDQFSRRRLRPDRACLPLLPGEIAAVSRVQCREIGRHQVDLPAHRLRFPRVQAADAEVGVKTDDDSLKQLLVRFPGGRDQLFSIGRDTADQTTRRNNELKGRGLTSSRLTPSGHHTCPGA